MAPMETQVREHQIQLKRRLESIKRIHQATDTLEDRINELAQVEDSLVAQIRSIANVGLSVQRALQKRIHEESQRNAA
jgi:prefoldin subunit 5